MKKLLLIFGGQAVGKMTVGEEVEKQSGLKLFHNHMTIELANHFYGFNHNITDKSSFSDLRDRLRFVVFDNIAKSHLRGLIFTSVMYYDDHQKWRNDYIEIFREGAKSIGEDVKVYIVELKCDIKERLKRNSSKNRLIKKPSKTNVLWTEMDIQQQLLTKRIEANIDEIKNFNVDGFIKIDNTNISPYETAKMIISNFDLNF